MSNFVIVNPGFGGAPPVTQTDQTNTIYPNNGLRFPIGATMLASDAGSSASLVTAQGGTANNPGLGYARFVYVQGSNIGSSGMVAMIVPQTVPGTNVVYQAQACTAATNSQWPVGVAAAVLNATSQYGWVQIEGICDFVRFTNSSIAAGIPLYQGATAGILHSATADGSYYRGITPVQSYTSSQTVGVCYLQNPSLAPGSAVV